ncbi:TetR/AcrR family transcriptional regulator [Mycobacterium sp. SVM_VP21]|nr:TetR/AcrR family transcriptional regulator [Mycobacterium sp. SVM_VP21]
MADRNTQEQRVRASTEALLDAAVKVVSERGYAGASPALIASHAGFDRKMVHHRFGSKEGLFRALFERSIQQPLLAPTAEAGVPGLDRALNTMLALEDMWRNDPAFLRAVFTVAFQVAGTSSDLNEVFEQWIDAARDAVERALVDGQRDGSVRADLDAARAAQVAVDATTGMTFRWCRDPDNVSLDREIRDWVAAAQQLFGAR